MKRQSTESLENLRAVGKRYNELCDLIDQTKNDSIIENKSTKIFNACVRSGTMNTETYAGRIIARL